MYTCVFKTFYKELNNDRSYETIEFRLRYQKKLIQLQKNNCVLIQQDLKKLIYIYKYLNHN